MKRNKKLELTSQLMQLGGSIREKLDKRGWRLLRSSDDNTYDQLLYFEDGNKTRTQTEVIEPMKRFIAIFEALSE